MNLQQGFYSFAELVLHSKNASLCIHSESVQRAEITVCLSQGLRMSLERCCVDCVPWRSHLGEASLSGSILLYLLNSSDHTHSLISIHSLTLATEFRVHNICELYFTSLLFIQHRFSGLTTRNCLLFPRGIESFARNCYYSYTSWNTLWVARRPITDGCILASNRRTYNLLLVPICSFFQLRIVSSEHCTIL